MKPFSPHPPSLLWYTVFIGTTDQTKIKQAECLLDHIWPEKDATTVLKLVGNPAQHLAGVEATELRSKLGHMLYPEYDALC